MRPDEMRSEMRCDAMRCEEDGMRWDRGRMCSARTALMPRKRHILTAMPFRRMYI
jgi:hypothetical protein